MEVFFFALKVLKETDNSLSFSAFIIFSVQARGIVFIPIEKFNKK